MFDESRAMDTRQGRFFRQGRVPADEAGEVGLGKRLQHSRKARGRFGMALAGLMAGAIGMGKEQSRHGDRGAGIGFTRYNL
jgi:hypothetical protein